MTRGKYRRKREPRQPEAPAPVDEEQQAPSDETVEERAEPEPVEEEEEARNPGALLATGLLLAGSGALVGLLLSGWTPGPAARPPSSKVAVPAPATRTVAPTVPRTPPPPPPPATTPLPRRSAVAELFANNCGVCHALKAAGTSGRIGPDLDKLEPSRLRVLRAISYGGSGSGVMPARILAGPQATRVAAYVARVSRR